ncbi:MAG TPA: SelB C-terminal domain-containing protein, partial [Actinomycetospora sp.]|nr:SelB C-terminal domain-containing protein [Actinomycetospora sp.]
RAVARVALNLRGVGLDEVGRGDALTTPGRWLRSDVVDVRVGPPRGSTAAVDLPQQVMLHVGSAAVAARVRPLSREDAPDDPSGATRTVRLTLRDALPLRPGDHALLRDPGAHRVLGGVTVLDVRPPSLRRRGAARARAGELATTEGAPDARAELARRRVMRHEELVALGAAVPDDLPTAAGWLVDPAWLTTLAERLVAAVAEHAEAQPLDAGLPAKAAARALDLPDPRLLDLVLAEPGAASLAPAGGRIRARDAGGLPDAVRAAVAMVREDLADAPFSAPEAHRLAELGLRTRELGAAVKEGALLKVGDGIYLAPDAADAAVARLADLPSPFTLSEARQALGTTRRVAVPLLEYLARQGRTRRDAEGRHALR